VQNFLLEYGFDTITARDPESRHQDLGDDLKVFSELLSRHNTVDLKNIQKVTTASPEQPHYGLQPRNEVNLQDK
jgi:hypothetical protein